MTDPKPRASTAYPSQLIEREWQQLAERRTQAGCGDPAAPPVGLALSGGGIRSATFCLGVLQALARATVLRRVDFLSTVSGGGYCGGFLGRLIGREAWAQGTRSGIRGAEAELADRDSCVVNWLRDHGRYLSPNGAGDAQLALAVVLRNWVAVATVLLMFVAAVLAAVVLVRVVLDGYGVHAVAGVIQWSPFWLMVLPWTLLAVPLGWAYWIVPRVDPRTSKAVSLGPLRRAALIAIALGAAAVGYQYQGACLALPLAPLLGLAALLLCVAGAVLWWLWKSEGWRDPPRRDRLARSWLSQKLAATLVLAGLSAALALIDSLGETLYAWLRADDGGVGAFARVGGLLAGGGGAVVVRWLLSLAQQGDGKGRVSLPLGVVAGLAAVLVAGLALVAVSATAHAVAWGGLLWPGCNRLGSIGVLLVATGLLSFLFGRTIRFANDSSQQALYGARLARAYLGASNPKRMVGAGRRITDPIEGDDSSMSAYVPHKHGGPLHLINVTLNETVAGESQIEHRDRKGLAFAVGPAGLSAGVRHHALWAGAGADTDSTNRVESIAPREGFRIFAPPALPGGAAASSSQPVESLSLATWVAVSGAAVAPGLGAKTSLGFSLLLTVFNIRLGYWWDSEITPAQRRTAGESAEALRPKERLGEIMAGLFPVQTNLFYELLGRFYGPNRRYWYLSDGGHFENTATYELIRRRVPFIVVCDCGQDADFDFADVANLVRKARTDFKAEIRFLAASQIRGLPAALRPHFGLPADFSPLFSPGPTGRAIRARTTGARPCAMLARVDYDGAPAAAGSAPATVILFLKPSLTGAEPEDVLHYAQEHAEFPHESTGDQYFDEAQWESYRMLGDCIASRLFAPAGAGEWTPASLAPPVVDG
ncbi:MAG: hypothetical protein ACRERC_02800 [Candidatus Binatia bacterium]